MSRIGHGYGSEWHLLRYLGYHRNGLNRAVLDAIRKADGSDGGTINWRDSLFSFSAKRQALYDDCEWGGVEFIWDADVTQLWNQYWPVRGTSPQWDAVGKLVSGESEDWLLVEAKAHLDEMESPWHAKNAESQAMIRSAMAETAKVVTHGGVPTDAWLNKFYQYANRLAVLNFLDQTCSPPIPARLIFIYFYGDLMPNHEKCPQTQDEWEDHLHAVHSDMDIDPQSPLMQRVHNVYLAVNPNAGRTTLSGRLARNMVARGETEEVFTALLSEFEAYRAGRQRDAMVQYVARLVVLKWRQSNPGEEDKYRMKEALKEYLEDRSEYLL